MMYFPCLAKYKSLISQVFISCPLSRFWLSIGISVFKKAKKMKEALYRQNKLEKGLRLLPRTNWREEKGNY